MSKRKGVMDIRAYARRHTETAVKTLVSIASCSKSPPAARVAASTALLDRGWGRAAQFVELSGEVTLERIERVIVDDRPALQVTDIDAYGNALTQEAKPLTH